MGAEEPRNAIERAAEAAFQAAQASLGAEGATVERMYVAIHSDGLPDGELNAVTAVNGDKLAEDVDERSRDVFAFLLSEAIGCGKALGLTLKVFPMTGHGHG